MTSEYEAEVFAWGSQNPGKDRRRLSHAEEFSLQDIETDGAGNVVRMPLLRRKPCFGRPEVYFRQADPVRMVMNKWGKQIESRSHACGRCKIRRVCGRLSKERVTSDSSMKSALIEWRDYCRVHHGGARVYVGEGAGRLWTRFLKAVADRGPFTNSNDARLVELEREAKDARRAKWVRAKRRQRQAARKARRASHLPPSKEFVANAINERDRRAVILESCAGDPTLPRCISKITRAQARRTAEITADVWLASTLLDAAGRNPVPGKIARYMVDDGRSHGLGYGSLKARVANDLIRIAELERPRPGRGPIWPKFDPDIDLWARNEDEDAPPAQVSELDEILRGLI